MGVAIPLANDATYGSPSTNASDSLVVLGFLAYRLNNEWLWAGTVLSVLLIVFSRLYLGVQFPSGVLSGWILGLGVQLLFVKIDAVTLPRWITKSVLRQVGIAFCLQFS